MTTICLRLVAALLVFFGLAGHAAAQAQSQSVTAVLSSDACPGTGCVLISVQGLAGVGVQVTGTFSGTLTFESSVDGVTFVATNLLPAASATPASTTTSTGVWHGNVGGLLLFRVRCSTYSSGSARVTILTAPTAAS